MIKNFTKVLSANFITAIIGFIGSFVFPKILSIESYALFHEFTLYVGYIGILHLGFSSGMAVNYAGKEYENIDKKQYKTELKLLYIILLIFTFVFGIIWFITKNRMLGFITLAIFPVCIINSYKSFYQAWKKFNEYTKISLVCSIFVPLIAILYYLFNRNLSGVAYIIIYLLVYWVVLFFLFISDYKKLYNVSTNKIFSIDNLDTEKTGFALVIGNYINTLFVSADKQFVNIFYGVDEFAFYSFGISMQALMTVFINSIAQPLFPEIATGKISNNEYSTIKKVLLIFGSLSGIAYFGLSLIIKIFLPKYIESLNVISFYFVVFPAMAVINCLYVNMYKIKKLTKKYIITLFSVLMISVLLNIIGIRLFNNFLVVAIATVITYYIWLIISGLHFKEIMIDYVDVIFLILYFIIYFLCINLFNDINGCLVYVILMFLIIFILYRKILKSVYIKIKSKLNTLFNKI